MTQGERAEWAKGRACDLAVLVRDEGRDSIATWLAQHDRQALEAIVVTLAAMTPVDRPVSELLAWIDSPTPAPKVRLRLAPCGTRAAAERHRDNGQALCDPCREAVRAYDRERARSRRGTAVENWRVA